MTAALTDLLTESRQLGFLGPGPVEVHLAHAAAFAEALTTAPARALDLGAGGGLPGLVLAATVWPDTRWVLLDAQLRRTTFLERAVEALGLGDRVRVVTARAEEAGRHIDHRGLNDLVVARSFAAPAVTAECAAPLLQVGGLLLASEPPAADLAARWPAEPLAELGFSAPVPIEIAGEPPTHLVRLDLVRLAPDRYPRRVGIPAKRPLF